jgi:hypothetical protein
VVASVLVIGAPITAVLHAVVNGSQPAPSVVAAQVVIALAVAALAIIAVRSTRRDPGLAR